MIRIIDHPSIVFLVSLFVQWGAAYTGDVFRRSTGFKLVNQGVDTRSLQTLSRPQEHPAYGSYSELSPERFRDFWKD
jgi:hypothetical protein